MLLLRSDVHGGVDEVLVRKNLVQGFFVKKPVLEDEIADRLARLGGLLTNAVTGGVADEGVEVCLLYTSPSPRDGLLSRMPSSA